MRLRAGAPPLEQSHAVLKARIEDGNVSLVGIDKMTVEPDFHGRTIDYELRCVMFPAASTFRDP